MTLPLNKKREKKNMHFTVKGVMQLTNAPSPLSPCYHIIQKQVILQMVK